jgi:hypothetical protein
MPRGGSREVATRTLPETAHGLTLDEWCQRFERLFIGTPVRITERKVAVVTRDRKIARRKGIPESEEYCSYSMHRVPDDPEKHVWKGSFVSAEVSLLWEQGQEPEAVARYFLSRLFHLKQEER